MDAYSESMSRLVDARLAELRREAAHERLARALRDEGGRARGRWLRRRRRDTVADVAVLPVNTPAIPTDAPGTAERRSA